MNWKESLIVILLSLAAVVLIHMQVLDQVTETGVLTFKGKSYHVIPWEGDTP